MNKAAQLKKAKIPQQFCFSLSIFCASFYSFCFIFNMKNWKVRFENSAKRRKKTLYAFLVSTKQKFPMVLASFLICHLRYFSLFIFVAVLHFLAYSNQTFQNIAKSKSWPIIKTLPFWRRCGSESCFIQKFKYSKRIRNSKSFKWHN